MSEPSSSHVPQPSVVPPQQQQQQQQQPTDFKVYRPASKVISLPVLPDDYFNPTSADIRAAQATLAARTQALVNAPLKTRAMRDAETTVKHDRWPETTIRIKFMDQTQLEKVFPSSSKMRSIYAFVRGCLRDDVKPIKFILYQPPKRDLKVSDLSVRDLTLAQLQLAPSSVLLIRFENDALDHAHIPAPLAAFALDQAMDLPLPPMAEQVDNGKGASGSTKATNHIPKTGEIKVPKWLKLGQKK